jgi:hypothetical protein
MNKLYVIKTITMYKHLCNKGIYPIEIEPNIYIPKFVVWKYENTPELHAAMREFKNN